MTFPTLSPSSLLEEVPVITDVPTYKPTTFDDKLEHKEQSVKADYSQQQQSKLRPPKQTVKVVYDRWNYDGEIEYVKETYEPTVSPTVDQVTTLSPTVNPTLSPSEVTVETEDPTSLVTASSSVMMKTPEPSSSSVSGGSSYASSFANNIHDKTSDQSSLAMMFASKPMDEDDDTSEHPTGLPTLEPDEDKEDYIMIETSPSIVVEYGKKNHRPTKQKGEEYHQQLVNSITNQIQQHLVKQKTKRARQKKKTKVSNRRGKRRKREAM
jgi:hypothetical protein